MDNKKAVIAFSQSEKVKTGIIWISHLLEMLGGLSDFERQGGEQVIRMLINMLFQEIQLAKNVTGDKEWDDAKISINQAIVMINSGVGPESIAHLTQALSKVTTIGQRSMSFLQEKGLV